MSDSQNPAPVAENTPVAEINSSLDQSANSGEAVATHEQAAQTGTPAEKVEAKKKLKSLKLKVDGKDIEEALPFEVEEGSEMEEYLRKNLQQSKAFNKRSQEYSELEKEVRTFVEQLRKDPRKVLSDPNIGIDIKKLAAEVIEAEIENSQKSPEQLEKEKLQDELKAIKEERENEKKKSQEAEMQRLQDQAYERYDMLMSKAIETSNLPKSPYIVKKMSEYMILGLQNNIDISPEDVVPIIREEMKNDLKEMFQVMPEDAIEELIGKDVLTKIRKKNLAKAKQQSVTPASKLTQDTGAKKGGDSKEPEKKMSYKQFFGGI